MREWCLLEPCLWLAVDVLFDKGVVTGQDAPELWRSVVKDGLLRTQPALGMALLEPMRAKRGEGVATNVDCSGVVIESRDHDGGARLFLKFLGQAYAFAPACLLALQHGLTQGIGRQCVIGSVHSMQCWKDGCWDEIGMPLTAEDLEGWRGNPAQLAGFEPTQLTGIASPAENPVPIKKLLELETRTRWLWRQQGKPVTRAPNLVDVLDLVAQRVHRFDSVWGLNDRSIWEASLAAAQQEASAIERVEFDWRNVRRSVGGRYPSHGHVGRVVFEGVFGPDLLYWLHAGSFLHVGQQTSIGLGGYGLWLQPSGFLSP